MFRYIIALILLASPAFGETYSWEDASGMHFTDDISKVPAKTRNKYTNRNSASENTNSAEKNKLFEDMPWFEDVYKNQISKRCQDVRNQKSKAQCEKKIYDDLLREIKAKKLDTKYVAKSNIEKEIDALKLTNRQKERLALGEVWIGLPSFAVEHAKGSPVKINKTETQFGNSEQWVYNSGEYLYFTNGILRTIQSSSR